MKLSRRQYLVVGLYLHTGSFHEIARILKISRRAARTHYKRAKLKFEKVGYEETLRILEEIKSGTEEKKPSR